MSGDPYATLGLRPGADDEAIRRAYLEKVKEHPPEQAPAEFERVRDAYEALRDPRRRARQALLGLDPLAPLVMLLDGRGPPRPFVGPGPWLAAVRGGGGA